MALKWNGPHGRESTYVAGCRCELCRAAASTAQYDRRVRKQFDGALLVSTAPVAKHLERLRAAGMTWQGIADQAEVSERTLERLRDSKSTTSCRKHIAENVLSVQPSPKWIGGGSVGLELVRELVRDLEAVGISQLELCQRLGLSENTRHLNLTYQGHRRCYRTRYRQLLVIAAAVGVRTRAEALAELRGAGHAS